MTNPALFNTLLIESIATRLLAHYAPSIAIFDRTARDCDLSHHELLDSIIDALIDHTLDDDMNDLPSLYRDADSLDLIIHEYNSFDLFELLASRIDQMN